MPKNAAIDKFNDISPKQRASFCYKEIGKELHNSSIIFKSSEITTEQDFNNLNIELSKKYSYCYNSINSTEISLYDVCLYEFSELGLVPTSSIEEDKVKLIEMCDQPHHWTMDAIGLINGYDDYEIFLDS